MVDRAVMSGPTSETYPRVELVAFDAKGTKVHIFTRTLRPHIVEVTRKVCDAMNAKAMTKEAAIALRDELMNKF